MHNSIIPGTLPIVSSVLWHSKRATLERAYPRKPNKQFALFSAVRTESIQEVSFLRYDHYQSPEDNHLSFRLTEKHHLVAIAHNCWQAS